MLTSNKYVQVIVPLAVEGTFTYRVPEELEHKVKVGGRVEVQFGKRRHYSALVKTIDVQENPDMKIKPILSILDEVPIVAEDHLRFWDWIAIYYCCSIGEVMQAALPSAFRLKSETHITQGRDFEEELPYLDDEEYLIGEAVQKQEFITVENVRSILGKLSVMPLIERLYARGVIDIQETLSEKYKPKTESCVRLLPPYKDGKDFDKAFNMLKNAQKQADTLLGIIQLWKQYDVVTVKNLRKRTDATYGALRSLADKGFIERYDRKVSRLQLDDNTGVGNKELVKLNGAQEEAYRKVGEALKDNKVALLHGVTGSGKTEIYAHFIREAIEKGQQVLYLLPEIALTTQITKRLIALFGHDLVIYHSRLNDMERLEAWKNIFTKEKSVILSVRSGMLLPFTDLGLIIVDEEHDSSFKQMDPSPRYNARDAAIYASRNLYNCNIILGSATPSIESYYNAQNSRYDYIPLMERFMNREMPTVELRKVSPNMKKSIFSDDLISCLKDDLVSGYQAIIFKNRRGYAPQLYCSKCDWHLGCRYCDVSLTYHRMRHKAICHYCGYSVQPPQECPDCGSKVIQERGIGTEKVQEELELLFPDATIKRLDYDSTRKKNAMLDLVSSFEKGEIDIMVGTQMITKGLNFNNIRTVGVLNADKLFTFPNFRATERAYQLLHQVSGRAGRGDFDSRVIIQSSNLNHKIFKWVKNHDFEAMYKQEIHERKEFSYPPIIRLINIHLEHKKSETVEKAASILTRKLRSELGSLVLGPSISMIPRLKNRYRYDIFLKLKNNAAYLQKIKNHILIRLTELRKFKGMSQLRINVDVDPY